MWVYRAELKWEPVKRRNLMLQETQCIGVGKMEISKHRASIAASRKGFFFTRNAGIETVKK